MKRFGIALVVSAVLGLFVAAPAFAGSTSCYPTCGDPGAGSHGRTITGDNWCPGSTVQIYVDGDFVGTANVGTDGTFTFRLPDNIADGTHLVEIFGLAADCETNTNVPITVVLGAGGTAFTGANVSTGILVLGALLIVGAGALVAGRRRKSTAE